MKMRLDFIDCEKIKRDIETTGYSVISTRDGETFSNQALIQLASTFGPIQRHKRSNECGITDLKMINPNSNVGSEEFEQPDLMPHTDGVYLNAFRQFDGKIERVLPPSLILFYCEQHAEKSGETTLIDVQRLLKDFFLLHPDARPLFTRSGAISYLKDGISAVDLPILEPLSNGKYRFRFRVDPLSFLSDWAKDSFKIFVEYLAHRTDLVAKVPLIKGDILIFDNYRMIHGRTDFTEYSDKPRHLKRIWIAQPACEYRYRLLEPTEPPTTANPVECYTSIPMHNPANLLQVQTGIEAKLV